jgi:hypothetical protein
VTPQELEPSDFQRYPAKARQLAKAYLDVLRQMPLPLLVAMLRELRAYDWKFPREQQEVEWQLTYLRSCGEVDRSKLFQPFAPIPVPPELQHLNWVNDPETFLESYTTALWSMRKIDDYRAAATSFVEQLEKSKPETKLPGQRVTIVVIGRDAKGDGYRLFRKLRPLGVHMTGLQLGGASSVLVGLLTQRADQYPLPYGHWYVDGGAPWSLPADFGSKITLVSYPVLAPVRKKALSYMGLAIQQSSGPEALGSRLKHLEPQELDADVVTGDLTMQHFYASVFTEGSGTQIFSTTFVQWTAREALRRAQPLTMVIRFAPRQEQRPMDDMFRSDDGAEVFDPEGSLIDGDMGAFYTYLAMQNLSEARGSAFLAWFEDHSEAVVVAPSFPRGTESDSPITMGSLLSMMLT